MIKWPITYTDYNGETRTEDFYFNLNKAEIMDMNLRANGSYGEYLQRIVEVRDHKKIAEEYKRLILKSYGEKSVDGKRFIKSDELAEAFSQTEAYSELYMQLATEAGAAQKFIEGVLPKVQSDSNPSMEKHMSLV